MRVIAKPFVKWAGGKGNLLKSLESLLPDDFDTQVNVTYSEPFVGGGAMLFYMIKHHANITRAVINDINKDLIKCYKLIKDNPQALIERLQDIERNYYHNDIKDKEELYYAYRDQYNRNDINDDERAALFIFLNHTCFNGLYRVNSSGNFNVPYGRHKRPIICNKELILANHRLFSSIDLIIREPGDYKLVECDLNYDQPNLVYLDPPYRPLNDTSYFKEYSVSPFGDAQQEELKQFCDRLTLNGCQLMLSNSDSRLLNGESYFEQLYQGYNIQRILAPRFINANAENRSKLTEVVIRNY